MSRRRYTAADEPDDGTAPALAFADTYVPDGTLVTYDGTRYRTEQASVLELEDE